jgi:hypothetical protein
VLKSVIHFSVADATPHQNTAAIRQNLTKFLILFRLTHASLNTAQAHVLVAPNPDSATPALSEKRI